MQILITRSIYVEWVNCMITFKHFSKVVFRQLVIGDTVLTILDYIKLPMKVLNRCYLNTDIILH